MQLFYELADTTRGALPEWMADAGICAAMTRGKPLVDISALLALKELLEAQDGIAAASNRGSMPPQEGRDAKHSTNAN